MRNFIRLTTAGAGTQTFYFPGGMLHTVQHTLSFTAAPSAGQVIIDSLLRTGSYNSSTNGANDVVSILQGTLITTLATSEQASSQNIVVLVHQWFPPGTIFTLQIVSSGAAPGTLITAALLIWL